MPTFSFVALFAGFLLALVGCPEAEEKREEITNTVGHAAKKQLDDVERRVNASAKKVAEKLNAAAEAADEATNTE